MTKYAGRSIVVISLPSFLAQLTSNIQTPWMAQVVHSIGDGEYFHKSEPFYMVARPYM
jgi:hypothetical protein